MPARSSVVFARTVAGLAAVLGIGSLSLFAFFLWTGGLDFIDLRLSEPAMLVWDTGLCALFFLQHSCMIRKSFRQWFGSIAPEYWHGVVYTVSSAIALVVLVACWQTSAVHIYTGGTTVHLLMRGLLLCCLAGVAWGTASLKDFDAFGTKAFLRQARGEQRPTDELTVAGPYRFVRHPFYGFGIVAVWAVPTLSLDRLVFNALFTAWIILGANLEERDLFAIFGQNYRDYQRLVPMFVPKLRASRTAAPGTRSSAAGRP